MGNEEDETTVGGRVPTYFQNSKGKMHKLVNNSFLKDYHFITI